jgi:hypothetical protein
MQQQINKKILDDSELKNKGLVSSWIHDKLKHRRAFKGHKFYINICKIYDFYPDLVEGMLNNMNDLGYHKDYFHIMYHSRNGHLNDYIMDIVVNQISLDYQNMKKGKKITTLGKWLPKEDSKIDKKIKFVIHFCDIYFDEYRKKFNVINVSTLKRKYRKMRTQFNDYIGTIEKKLSTKQYSSIDFSKVSRHALRVYGTALDKHEVIRDQVEIAKINSLKKIKLDQFVSTMMKYSKNYNNQIFNCVFTESTLNYDCDLMNIAPFIKNNTTLIADMSNQTFINGHMNNFYGLMLMVLNKSSMINPIIVAGKKNKNAIMHNQNDVYGNLLEIQKYCKPCDEIVIDDYQNVIDKNTENLIVLTNKTFDINKQVSFMNVVLINSNPNEIVTCINNRETIIHSSFKTYNEMTNRKEILNNMIEEFNKPNDMMFLLFVAIIVFIWCIVLI